MSQFAVELVEPSCLMPKLGEIGGVVHRSFLEPPWNFTWKLEPSDDPDSGLGFVTMLAQHGADFFVARDSDGRIVGVGAGIAFDESMLEHFSVNGAQSGDYYCATVAVDSSARKNGLFRRLVDARIERARERGIPRVYVRTRVDAQTVIDYYMGLGFREVTRYMVDQGGTRSERVVMVMDLDPAPTS